jgi:hypothetical protein
LLLFLPPLLASRASWSVMSLITDELVWVMRTVIPCRRNALASRAENVFSSYHFCHVVTQAMLRVFVRSGRSGGPARLWGIATSPPSLGGCATTRFVGASPNCDVVGLIVGVVGEEWSCASIHA